MIVVVAAPENAGSRRRVRPHNRGMDVRRATTPEQIRAAAHLFDDAPRPEPTAAFLADPASTCSSPTSTAPPWGLVSGIVTVHPDKGAELFLMELGVDDAAQGEGVGKRTRSGDVRARRCARVHRGLDVTEPDNVAARATYRRAGATSEDMTVATPSGTSDPTS